MENNEIQDEVTEVTLTDSNGENTKSTTSELTSTYNTCYN
jgi:hypothetical protein